MIIMMMVAAEPAMDARIRVTGGRQLTDVSAATAANLTKMQRPTGQSPSWLFRVRLLLQMRPRPDARVASVGHIYTGLPVRLLAVPQCVRSSESAPIRRRARARA
jgi:hypothetical protein